jgi:hypothetical protein
MAPLTTGSVSCGGRSSNHICDLQEIDGAERQLVETTEGRGRLVCVSVLGTRMALARSSASVPPVSLTIPPPVTMELGGGRPLCLLFSPLGKQDWGGSQHTHAFITRHHHCHHKQLLGADHLVFSLNHELLQNRS